jgi:hypothetical protein
MKRRRLNTNRWASAVGLADAGCGFALAELAESREAYGQKLRKYLLGRHVSGKMPAQELCLITHLVTMAGGCGVHDVALAPSKDSIHNGNASRRVRDVLESEFDAPKLYNVLVPMYDKQSTLRESVEVPVNLPHEALAELYNKSKPMEGYNVNLDLGSLYTEHPGVQQALQEG